MFNFTGGNQSPSLLNPAPSQIYAKLWGAGGAGSDPSAPASNKGSGGVGGFTKVKLNALASTIVVVGEGGLRPGAVTVGARATYGGGGAGGDGDGANSDHVGGSSGGGLTGIFSNS